MLSNDSSDSSEPSSEAARLQPFFPLWCDAAGRLVEYLAEPLEDTTTFLVQMSSRNSATDMLHFVYQQHGRLRTFCIVQVFVSALVLVSGVATASCKSNGQLPFVRRKTGRYVFHCVAIGAAMVLILSNLVVMLGCHSKLSDGLQQLPSVYAKALADLKLYINETVLELCTELEEEEGAALRKFLTEALDVKFLQPKPGAAAKGEMLRESLEKQGQLALLGLDEMQRSVHAFETRTRLWAYAQLVGLVVVPVMMVKLCAILALLGFGAGFGLRSRSSWLEGNGLRHTGALMLANAALMLLFYVLSTPLLVILVATGLAGECYLCKPYRERSYHGLQAVTAVAWPYSTRGELFARLAPQQILTKCSGDGVSIAELELQNNTDVGIEAERRDRNETAVGTAGNCRPVYNILKTSVDLICSLCIQDVLGVAFSLALSMFTLLAVLPSVLALSQYLFANEPYGSSSEMALAESFQAVAKSGKRKSLVGRLLQNILGRGSTFLSNPWHSRLAEIYGEEGVDIERVISNAGSNVAKNRKKRRVRKHAKGALSLDASFSRVLPPRLIP